ncbi:putative transferase [Medicago truncatula]|uniref:O-acyltransferase (WSD1-like) family protein n=2 Tax=Medicago truncatula TaxID=3880 RepID=G7I4A5_MEDTR|nr:O-acyltransferase WSD1 isoform X2 [Medicago truncatula]AES58773.1 O-acyltransferase (WSD1-like) family protein [Medicago truncatula]RHN76730.1 putative transferase [Medicago truncatula]
MACSSEGGGEPLSPAARLFHSPSFNCYVIAIIGCKTSINPQVIRDGLCQTILKHPRFTSKLVKKGRKTRWTETTIDLDNHIIVPQIDSKIDFPDRFVEDYISNFTKTPLDISKPLWELHLLNIKTSNAESIGIFRIHHSLGDGTSLISLLIAATRKTSDPNALPTVPTTRKRDDSNVHNCSIIVSFWLSILWGLRLIWNTIVDVLLLVLTILFFKDTHTPLKGAHGVELNTKRFVYLMVSMDDIKLVKAEMKTTINDVLLGLTQAGLARYLNREYGVKNANDGAAMSKSGIPKNIRLRASILVNIRASPGIQDLADMMAEKGKARWGNKMGYIIFPFNIALQEDPLEYVRQAKATIDRKKQSLEAICSYACAKLVLNLFGVKIAGVITRRVLFHTTMAFSNVAGPVEEISFYGHPVAFIAPSVYGHPHALTIHFQSYANQMTISMAVDPTIIPDPYLLCDDFEESLKLICDNVVKKRHIAEII